MITITQLDYPGKRSFFFRDGHPSSFQPRSTGLDFFSSLRVSRVRVHFALSPKLGTTRSLEIILPESNSLFQQGHHATLTSLEYQAAPMVKYCELLLNCVSGFMMAHCTAASLGKFFFPMMINSHFFTYILVFLRT